MSDKPRPIFLVGVGAAMLIFVLGSMLLSVKAAERISSLSTLWLLDVLSIVLPPVVVWGGRRVGHPKLLLLALILWPACFGFAGLATLMPVLRSFVVPAHPMMIRLGALAGAFGALGCHAIAFRAAVAPAGLVSGAKDSTLAVAIEQGPWAVAVFAALGAAMQLQAIVFHPSLIVIALTVVTASIMASYLASLAATLLLSMVSGPEPDGLLISLGDLLARTGISFSRIIYLDSTLATGTFCQVRPDWLGYALAINKWTFDVLSAEERLAVLAHEAGHIRQRYLAKEIAVSATLSTAYILVFVFLMDAFHLRGPVWFVGLSTVGTMMNLMAHAAFRRWLERDADTYASQLVGAEPVVGALSKLSGAGTSGLLSHHDALDVRVLHARRILPGSTAL